VSECDVALRWYRKYILSRFWGDIMGQEILNLDDPYIQYYCTVWIINYSSLKFDWNLGKFGSEGVINLTVCMFNFVFLNMHACTNNAGFY